MRWAIEVGGMTVCLAVGRLRRHELRFECSRVVPGGSLRTFKLVDALVVRLHEGREGIREEHAAPRRRLGLRGDRAALSSSWMSSGKVAAQLIGVCLVECELA